MGFATFALNFALHGLHVRGYHVFNISLHIINSLLLYLLITLSFRSDFLRDSALAKSAKTMAFCVALVFVSHPVHTEAVTYIYQRITSLAFFFYVLSFVLYIKFRLSISQGTRRSLVSVFLFLAVLTSASLGALSKETALTLPFLLFYTSSFSLKAGSGKDQENS